MPVEGADFFTGVIALDAVLLLVLVLERTYGTDEYQISAGGEYWTGVVLLIALTFSTVALFSGANAFDAVVALICTGAGLFGTGIVVAGRYVGRTTGHPNDYAYGKAAMLIGLVIAVRLAVGLVDGFLTVL
jgi:hypothetical protein